MIAWLYRLDRRLAVAEAWLIGVLLLGMAAIAFVQVLTRYCFFYSLVWSEEVSRYGMIWLTFVGASLAVARQEHISIELLGDRLHLGALRLRTILNLLILGFLLVSIGYSVQLVRSTLESGQLTPAIGLPMVGIYIPVLAALIAAAFHALLRLAAPATPREAA